MMLTDTAIKNAKPGDKPKKLTDEKGLFLLVHPKGGKYWRLKYRFGGRQTEMALGVYPDVSLKEARERRDEARKLLANSTDPGAVKKAQKAVKANTFLKAAQSWRETWQTHVAPSTNKSIWGNLERNIFPILGDMPVIEAADSVLDALQKIEAAGKGDTLRKARGAISLIFNHAKNNLKIKVENPTKSFDRYTFKKCETTNYPAILDLPGIAKLLRNIDTYHGTLPGVEAALRLAPLLFQRIGELRMMRWVDLNLDGPEEEWNYFVTKTKVEHNVPLARQAVEILQDLHQYTGHDKSGFVFPGMRAGRPISDATLNRALQSMGYCTKTEMTGHGFRAIGYTHLRQTLRYPMDIVNFQISHRPKGEDESYAGKPYARMTFRDERREMMQAWADYLDKLKTGADVIPLRA